MDARLPCLGLAYYSAEFVRKTLDTLLEEPNLDLYLIENPVSGTASQIEPYARSLVESGRIRGYFRFDDNISNNAYEVVLDHLDGVLSQAPNVVLTDLDLGLSAKQTYQEQLAILTRHPEVGACGITLDPKDLPHQTFADAAQWVPKVTSVHSDYVEQATGIHMLTLRGSDLAAFRRAQRRHAWEFRDSVLRFWLEDVQGLRWGTTLTSVARHLTWIVYQDPEDPYTRMKRETDFDTLWRHSRYCAYTVVTSSGSRRFFPYRAWARGRMRAVKRRVKGK